MRPISIVLYACYVIFLDAAVVGWGALSPKAGLVVAIVVTLWTVVAARRRARVDVRVTTIEDELHALWSDEDHLWDQVRDHLARQQPSRPDLRKELVN